MKHLIEKVTVHCSVTKNGVRCETETIRKWHKDRGFDDIGYHGVIQPDGEFSVGRDLHTVGAHVKGANTGNLGVCFAGTDKFTWRAFRAFAYWFEGIRCLYDLGYHDIYCHYEFDSAKKQSKSCPNIRSADLVLWMALQDDNIIKKYIKKEIV